MVTQLQIKNMFCEIIFILGNINMSIAALERQICYVENVLEDTKFTSLVSFLFKRSPNSSHNFV